MSVVGASPPPPLSLHLLSLSFASVWVSCGLCLG